MSRRRVVTGHDAHGHAVFVSDERIEPVCPPGRLYHQLWGGDVTPEFPDDGSCPEHTAFYPPIGGFRFIVITIPVDTQHGPGTDTDHDVVEAQYEELTPGIARYMEHDGDGMHATPTLDFVVVLSGSVRLELDAGASAVLYQGDTLVQNGTRHRWTNPGDTPAVLSFFSIGAHHQGVSTK